MLRARVVTPEVESKIITHSYFVDEDMQDKYTLPIVSITTNSDYFFDPNDGIYVNGNWDERGRETEIPAHIEFFEPQGELGFSLNAGIRIHGGATRRYPLKSLRIYARSEYDEKNIIEYDLFPNLTKPGTNEKLTSFKRLLLRNSGNDFTRTMFRDAFSQELVKHMNFDTQSYRPSIVFINGEYWGIQNIRERYDDRYLENTYDLDPESITILEAGGVLDDGDPIGEENYKELIKYIQNNSMIESVHYNYVSTKIDIENFIDYYIAQIFFANNDWPHNNIRFWKKNVDQIIKDDQTVPYGHDGKWRWMLYDTDHGFGLATEPSHNTLDHATGDNIHKIMFSSLLENNEFKKLLINRFLDMLNSTFTVDRIVSLIEEMESTIQPEIKEHIDRWVYPNYYDYWEYNVEVMKKFAMERPAYQFQHLKDYFSINNTADLSVYRNPLGNVQVNSIVLNPDTPGIADSRTWKGTYFSEIPVTLSAQPKEGYVFKEWIGLEDMTVENRSSSIITLFLEKDTHVIPVFVSQPEQKSDHSIGGIQFTEQTYSIDQGKSYQAVVQAVYTDRSLLPINQDVTFTSSDSSIANVKSTGEITGHSSGGVTINAKYLDYETSMTITVKDPDGSKPEPPEDGDKDTETPKNPDNGSPGSGDKPGRPGGGGGFGIINFNYCNDEASLKCEARFSGNNEEVAQLGDEIFIKFSRNFSSEAFNLTIEKLEHDEDLLNNEMILLSPLFNITTDKNLEKPVTISIKYDPDQMSPSSEESIYFNSTDEDKWIKVESSIDNEYVSAEVSSLGIFAVFATEIPLRTIEFDDTQNHWAEEFINLAVNKGLVDGYPDNTFRPNHFISREEIVVILTRALPLEPGVELTFEDRDQISSWAAKEVSAAVSSGIIGGYEDATFRPQQNITRAELAAIIARALNVESIASNTNFVDDEQIPSWAKGYIMSAVNLGIIQGRGQNSFAPNDNATRAEALTMLIRMLSHLSQN